MTMLFWLIGAGFCMLAAVVMILFGIVRKKYHFTVLGLPLFLAGLACAVVFLYLGASNLHRSIRDWFGPRSGREIYVSLFGESPHACLEVIHHQDQVIPRIDNAIWLQVKTCPDEVNRILSKKPYSSIVETTASRVTIGPSENEPWFNPAALGDSLLICTWMKADGINSQILYLNSDSTAMYCVDYQD